MRSSASRFAALLASRALAAGPGVAEGRWGASLGWNAVRAVGSSSTSSEPKSNRTSAAVAFGAASAAAAGLLAGSITAASADAAPAQKKPCCEKAECKPEAPAGATPETPAAAASSTPPKKGWSKLFYHGNEQVQENPYAHPNPKDTRDHQALPIIPANKSTAPNVPPPCNRDWPAHMIVDITTTSELMNVSPLHKYPFWTYDSTVPGPMIRCRVGDVVEIRYTNKDKDGIGHNIDFHSVTGPGGGAAVTFTESGETKVATFKVLDPGLFIYHCAAAPVPTHIANGMYGLMLVEPEQGLTPVDKEFYVLQSEIYAEESGVKGVLDHSYADGLMEHPMYVVFNGAEGALTEKGPLIADQGDRIRIFFGNAGPNLISSFHVIGTVFDKVYREGDLISPPGRCIQTTLVPPGGSAVVEINLPVAGNFTLVDHALFRLDKGCVGFLKVRPHGDKRRDIYDSMDPPAPCPGCKLHN